MGSLKNLEIEANSWEDDKGSRKAREIIEKLSGRNSTQPPQTKTYAPISSANDNQETLVDSLSKIQ